MVQCDWCDKLFKKPAELAKHKKEYKQVDARKIFYTGIILMANALLFTLPCMPCTLLPDIRATFDSWYRGLFRHGQVYCFPLRPALCEGSKGKKGEESSRGRWRGGAR